MILGEKRSLSRPPKRRKEANVIEYAPERVERRRRGRTVMFSSTKDQLPATRRRLTDNPDARGDIEPQIFSDLLGGNELFVYEDLSRREKEMRRKVCQLVSRSSSPPCFRLHSTPLAVEIPTHHRANEDDIEELSEPGVKERKKDSSFGQLLFARLLPGSDLRPPPRETGRYEREDGEKCPLPSRRERSRCSERLSFGFLDGRTVVPMSSARSGRILVSRGSDPLEFSHGRGRDSGEEGVRSMRLSGCRGRGRSRHLEESKKGMRRRRRGGGRREVWFFKIEREGELRQQTCFQISKTAVKAFLAVEPESRVGTEEGVKSCTAARYVSLSLFTRLRAEEISRLEKW